MRQRRNGFEAAVFLSRWLLAPFLVGLLCAIVLLIYRFFADLYDLAVRLAGLGWHELVVEVLNLVDIALVANLVVIVVFYAYENFIRKVEPGEDWPAGLIEVDFGALKQRLLGSIAVIAAVDALAWYLELEKAADSVKLGWAVGFPLMFAAAMLMLAAADRLSRHPDDKSK